MTEKKHLLLLVFISSSVLMNAMETDIVNFFSTSYLRISSFFEELTSPKTSIIQDLQADRNIFEDKFKRDCDCIDNYKKNKEIHKECAQKLRLKMSLLTIDMDAGAFLRYCYYQSFHDKVWKDPLWHYKLADLFDIHIYHCDIKYKNSRHLERLTRCRFALIDGYSALGATLIAPYISLKQRRTFIRELIKYGFTPTQKDMQLAELILYDQVVAHWIPRLRMDGWFDLPNELKKHILEYMMLIVKKKYWLLPDTMPVPAKYS